MTPLTPSDYAMVTVRLNKPGMEGAAAFEEIKDALCLSAPDIDEKYGAIPLGRGDEYVVMIEKNLARHLKNEEHPNVIGVFANPAIGGFAGNDNAADDVQDGPRAQGGLSSFGPAQSWSRRNRGKGPGF